MTDEKRLSRKPYLAQHGNALVVVLVVLLVAALGGMAYMSGKMDSVKGDMDTDVAESESSAGQENPVVAVVNGKDIKRQEVLNLMGDMPAQMRQMPVEQLFSLAIEQLINNQIVDKNAAKSGLEKDEDVKKQLKIAKTQIIRTKYVENEVKARITEEKLKNAYQEYLKNFPEIEEVKVAHILVGDEDTAKSLIKKLNNGDDFASLAKENSKDGTAANGGELGYFAKSDVVPSFADAAFATQVGTYTKKPVKSDFGYHIIRVDDKRTRPPAPYEQAKPFIEQELQRELLGEVIQDLRKDADIERFDINGNPLPEDQEPAAGDEESEQQSDLTEKGVEEESADRVQE